MTRIVAVDPRSPDAAIVHEAAAILRDGGLVAMPTETVYGLAANALDPAAVQRVYAAKGRPAFNPLIVHLADASELERVAREVPPAARALAERFWPGPLTLVLRRRPVVPDAITGGGDTVAVRVPDHAVARALIRAAGVPLAAPSANLFTRVSPTTAAHVAEQLGAQVALVLDAGACTVGIESTVVDLTTDPPQLLRPGGVPRDAIEEVIGQVGLPAATARNTGAPLRSPGMIARHYAPRTRLHLFATGDRGALDAWKQAAARGERVALLAWSPELAPAAGPWALPSTAGAYARTLYATLHRLEDEQVVEAWVEEPPSGEAWAAVRDRLKRAAQES